MPANPYKELKPAQRKERARDVALKFIEKTEGQKRLRSTANKFSRPKQSRNQLATQLGKLCDVPCQTILDAVDRIASGSTPKKVGRPKILSVGEFASLRAWIRDRSRINLTPTIKEIAYQVVSPISCVL